MQLFSTIKIVLVNLAIRRVIFSMLSLIFFSFLVQISFPIDTMLYPVEVNWDLVQKYLQLLVSESVMYVCYYNMYATHIMLNCSFSFSRTPVLYVIAVHHVHHYIFNEAVSLKLRHKMLNYVLNVPDKVC